MKTKTVEKVKMTNEHKGYVKNGVRRMILSAIAILLQIMLLIGLSINVSKVMQNVQTILYFVAAAMATLIYSRNRTSALKAPWMILIAAFPIAGAAMYLMIGSDSGTKEMKRRYKEIDEEIAEHLPRNDEELKELSEYSVAVAGIASYIRNYTNFPVYRNTDIKYFSEAMDAFLSQIEDIKKAKKFVFVEYHAIEDAEAFHMLEEPLAECAKRGVDVRIFYDDIGSIGFVDTDFVGRMESLGIRCRVFNRVSPVLNFFFNNRDHRKITVIDGKVGYTGGYNIANEYFNITRPYGSWKDSGIRLEGEAVRSLTLTFLEMWGASKRKKEKHYIENYECFIPEYDYKAKEDAFVIPYADSPLRKEPLAENVYISLVEKAHKFCYFTTPYLIVGDEMMHALSLAAKRGVDVRIITPGIPDKNLIYSVTRSYYHNLVRAGVKIYEWTPGFCHSKMCIVDDKVAACGTINLDFRSLYHHFENGCLIANSKVVQEIKADILKTQSESKDVSEHYLSGRSVPLKMKQAMLRIFAPLF